MTGGDGVAPGNVRKPSLTEWVQRLSNQEMPVFAHSARMLQELMGKPDAGVNELTQVILRDPALTARLMRVANSAYYNSSGVAVSSVSRALMVLGMDTVRQLFLALSLVDALGEDGPLRERVDLELGRSLHAAFQARALAQREREPALEEIFVSALLVNLGSLAFWSHGGDVAQVLDMALRKGVSDTGAAQKDIVGFRLSLLSAALAQEWKLPQLLTQSLRGSSGADARVRFVHAGWQIAMAAEDGWFTKAARNLGEKIAQEQRMSLREVGEFLHASTRSAAAMARDMGAIRAAERIPVLQSPPPEGDGAPSIFELPPPAGRYPKEDPEARLACLRKLAALAMRPGFDVAQALELAAQGVRDGCGMDRVLVLMLDREGTMRPRVAVGEQMLQLEQEFRWDTKLRSPNAFNRLLEEPGLLLVRVDVPNWRPPLLPSQLTALVQGHSFAAFPLLLLGRAVGMWYADRVPSGRPIDEPTGGILQTYLAQAAALIENGLKQVSAARAATSSGSDSPSSVAAV